MQVDFFVVSTGADIIRYTLCFLLFGEIIFLLNNQKEAHLLTWRPVLEYKFWLC